jgi:hypothetical protein
VTAATTACGLTVLLTKSAFRAQAGGVTRPEPVGGTPTTSNRTPLPPLLRAQLAVVATANTSAGRKGRARESHLGVWGGGVAQGVRRGETGDAIGDCYMAV